MDFSSLQLRLIDRLRESVRGGVVTERGLARLAGISQPHIHKVLKGTRCLSIRAADQILDALKMDVLDLIEPADYQKRNG